MIVSKKNGALLKLHFDYFFLLASAAFIASSSFC